MTEFLVEPDLFPRRISGEVWGAESVVIELAGERYRVEGLSLAQAASLASRYAPHPGPLPAERGEGTRIAVFRAPRSDFREIDTRGWDYSLDLGWSGDALTIAGMRVMARADFAASRTGIWTCVEDESEFWGVLENVLRPVLAVRLLASGGLLIHSAAANGWLFPSPSGGGKSTIARMAVDAGVPVLSDDLNAVVRTDKGLTLLPLPFTGDLPENELDTTPRQLTAIVALEKGDREAVRKLPLAEAVSLLVRCAPYVNQDPDRMPLLLERAAEIAGTAKRAVLTFRPGGDVWSLIAGA